MTDNSGKGGLIDPRRLDLRALAARANLPVPAPPVEPPASERLAVGELSPVGDDGQSDVGAAISRLVDRYNAMLEATGAYYRAYSFKEYLHRCANVSRSRLEPDPFNRSDFTKDFEGYVTYLSEQNDTLERLIAWEMARPRHILETRDRRAHTLVTGGSRSGKSELIKLLVHHYVKHPELGGVLVVDPHGDMARQIARWRDFAGTGADRLVYLDPTEGALHGAMPALNPLAHASASPSEVATVAGQLGDALAYFGGDGEGQTPQMQRLAAFCLQMLLEIEGSTLLDLMNGLTVPPRGEKGGPRSTEPAFVRRGRKHPDDVVRDFFQNDWNGESYRGTRDALKRRLQTHLRAPTFRQVMTAPDPVNLEAQLCAGKVVVVNCGFDSEAGDALGRFVMAQVAAIGRRRLDNPQLERRPMHVFVDEATQLMAPPFVKILERFAKTRIWLTMAQQGAGEGGEREFINRVRRSTGLKFLGRSGNVGELLSLVDLPARELPQLKQGHFIVAKTGEERSTLLLKASNPSPLRDDDHAMNPREWARIMADQVARYYRTPPKALAAPGEPAREDEADARQWRAD